MQEGVCMLSLDIPNKLLICSKVDCVLSFIF